MPISNNTVAIIGAGSVGSAAAYGLVNQGLCDNVYLIDKNYGKAKAEATDLENSIEFMGRNMHVKAVDYPELAGADIIVLTAAVPYIDGQTRLDMLSGSVKIVDSIIPKITASGFNGIYIVITNPVDIISGYIRKITGLPKNRVIGTGTSLDSARLKNLLSEIVNVDPRCIHAFSMGEHGDSQMIPWSVVRVGGKRWRDIVADNPDKFGSGFPYEEIRKRIVNMGWDIIKDKGSTNYGIASATLGIIKAIMHDENQIIPVSAYLDGEYGQHGIYAGVPAVINKSGVKEVVEFKMTDDEKRSFDTSADIIREYTRRII